MESKEIITYNGKYYEKVAICLFVAGKAEVILKGNCRDSM